MLEPGLGAISLDSPVKPGNDEHLPLFVIPLKIPMNRDTRPESSLKGYKKVRCVCQGVGSLGYNDSLYAFLLGENSIDRFSYL